MLLTAVSISQPSVEIAAPFGVIIGEVNDKLLPLQTAEGATIADRLGSSCTVITTSLLVVVPQLLVAV